MYKFNLEYIQLMNKILKLFYYTIATAFVCTGHPFFAVYCFFAGACVGDGKGNNEICRVDCGAYGRTTSPTGTIDTPPPNTSGSGGKNNPFRKYG